jgi:hypothetical protein
MNLNGTMVQAVFRAIGEAAERATKHEANTRAATHIRYALVRYAAQHIYLINDTAEARSRDVAKFCQEMRNLLRKLPDGLPPEEP